MKWDNILGLSLRKIISAVLEDKRADMGFCSWWDLNTSSMMKVELNTREINSSVLHVLA